MDYLAAMGTEAQDVSCPSTRNLSPWSNGGSATLLRLTSIKVPATHTYLLSFFFRRESLGAGTVVGAPLATDGVTECTAGSPRGSREGNEQGKSMF